MRFLVILAVASVALASCFNFVSASELNDKDDASFEETVSDNGLDLDEDDAEYDVDFRDIFGKNDQRSLIASWQARRKFKKIVAQMPCGWEQYGIPPLAPFRMSEGNFNFQRGFLDTLNTLFLLNVDGLDDIICKKLKVNVLSKVIKYHFIFPKITATADKYVSNTTIDALRELGVYVQYLGDGSLKFSMEKLSLKGRIKGKIPLLIGSAKLTSFNVDINLEKFNSDITGFAGGETVNQAINTEIEKFVVQTINGNSQKISDYIEETLKNEINPRLKGKDFWSLLNHIFSGNEKEDDPIVTNCVPR